MSWDRQQVKLFVKQIRKDCGDGWRFLVPALRKALVAEYAFHVARGQAAESVRVEDMDKLYQDMIIEAGLEDV